MKSILFLLLFSFATMTASAQPELYRIYDSRGKEMSFRKMSKAIEQAEIVFFGELHNNSVAHWLELQVLKMMADSDPDLALGMEMFEADDQLVIDEYFQGIIQEKHFLKEAKFWDNYKTDYKPLVEFARSQNIPLIATNIPQRYANLVYRKGLPALNELDPAALSYMCPLPFPVDFSLPNYVGMMEMMGGHGSQNSQNFVLAQAIKDATMAHFILQHLKSRMLHVNGAYHSMDGEGIIWYLKQARPELKILSIHTAEQSDLSKMDEDLTGKADIIIVVAEDMVKSY
jgi:uncharacterized iron-regulated protein